VSRVCAFARSRLWFVCVCLLPYGNITNYNGTSFTYNAANEITNSGYTYDGSGQETAGGGFSYAYNQANQATSITQNGQAQAIDYADAGQNEITSIGTTQINNTILGVTSSIASNGSSFFTRTPSGALVDGRTPTGKYYYVFDGLGSVMALTDTNGCVVQSYGYSPYGQQAKSNGHGVINLWRYAGEYNLDPVNGIYHIGARYYNTTQGSWTQQDPTSHLADLTQGDPFVYAGDDPINATDPSGKDLLGLGSSLLGFASTVVGCATVETGFGAALCVGGLAASSAAVGVTATNNTAANAGSSLASGLSTAATCATWESGVGAVACAGSVGSTIGGLADW